MTIHPFESANLGKAPFRFVGCEEKTYQAFPGAPIQPGSSCDYCGQGIRYVFWVGSADGQKFKVGCDCIRKTESEHNVASTAGSLLADKAEREARRMVKQAKLAANQRRIEAARAALTAKPALLTDSPHSYDWAKDKGLTARDEVTWLFKNGGMAGKIRACRIVEAAGA